MLKLLFLFLLLWSCGQVIGQGTAVTKSNDIVVIFAYRATRSDFVFDM